MPLRLGWSSPPLSPKLGPTEVSVWQLPHPETARPIEVVLARYLGLQPDSVVLRRSPGEKPELQGSPLSAGLAHSGDVALVAIAYGREIGVDVERLRAGLEDWSITSHALTDGERAALGSIPSSHRSDAFVWMWTRKEAILKAAGVGLALDPRLVELDGRDVVAVPPELGRASDWTIADLALPGHAAALALRGSLSRLLLYDARDAPRRGE